MLFAKKEKPLPQPVFESIPQSKIPNPQSKIEEGIFLGEDCYWNPAALPNGHVVAIGASGSGKTQTLKAIAFSLRQTYPDIQIFVIDFHGDQEITGETCYPLHPEEIPQTGTKSRRLDVGHSRTLLQHTGDKPRKR